MDFELIKQIIEQADFPKETADAINNIIGMAKTRNEDLSESEIQEIFALIDDAIVKNKQAANQLTELAEVMQDTQDAIVDAIEDEKELQKEAAAPPAAPVDPAAPTTQTP